MVYVVINPLVVVVEDNFEMYLKCNIFITKCSKKVFMLTTVRNFRSRVELLN